MKRVFFFIFIVIAAVIGDKCMFAQSYTINSNQQQVNINVPVIEKPVYIERYRTVYVDRPRIARKLDKPMLLLGYLWVYPEDLGTFKQVPVGVINSINAQNPYGHNNWRIPTPDELAVLEANADKIGLGDDIYLATDHCNGTLRLVAIEGEHVGCIRIGNTYWTEKNLGATSKYDKGRLVDYEYAVSHCPSGYRLPTKEEYEELINSGQACFGGMYGGSLQSQLYFPSYRTTGGRYYDPYEIGNYWTATKEGNSIIYMCFSRNMSTYSGEEPCVDRTTSGYTTVYDSDKMVRYVLDK